MINWWCVFLFSVICLALAIHSVKFIKLAISHIKIYKSTKAWDMFRSVKI